MNFYKPKLNAILSRKIFKYEGDLLLSDLHILYYLKFFFFFTNTKKMQNTNDVIVFKAEIL